MSRFVHILTLALLYTGALTLVVVDLAATWHLVAPAQWRWLSVDQQAFCTAVLVVSFIVLVVARSFTKDDPYG